MSKTYSAGIVTAYGAAKRAGYQGTYEDFCRQQAGYAESAATVEQAKNTAVSAASTATAKASEATTAATDAQTAKTQTEAAASQALTDIETARTGAISAVQTEGQTQTANARAQAQAAAQSATTASAKASEASASATNAGQSATNAAASATSAATSASAAQAVLESIPEDYSEMNADVEQLKADLGDVENTIDNLGALVAVNMEFQIGEEIVDYSVGELTSFYISPSSQKWISNSAYACTVYPVPDNAIKITVKANANFGGIIALLKSATYANKSVPDWATGWNEVKITPQGTESSYDVPSDCKYVYIYLYNDSGQNNRRPEYVKISYMIKTPEVDDELLEKGAAADAKVTGDEIKGLKNAVAPALINKLSWEDGFYIRENTGIKITAEHFSASTFVDIGDYDSIRFTACVVNVTTPSHGTAFYDVNKQYIAGSGIASFSGTDESHLQFITSEIPEGAKYARFTILTTTKDNFRLYDAEQYSNNLEMRMESLESKVSNVDSKNLAWLTGLVGMAHKADGRFNIAARMRMLCDIEWTPINPVPKQLNRDGTLNLNLQFEVGIPVRGVPYGAQLTYENWLGKSISFETFLSALKNPNSVIYDFGRVGTAYRQTAWYSINCSKAVTFALNLTNTYASGAFSSDPHINRVANAGEYSAEDIRVGDIIEAVGVHTAIVTDLVYNAMGELSQIEVSEAVTPSCRRKRWNIYGTFENFFTHFADYYLLRYDYVDDVPPVDMESMFPYISTSIGLNYGNKSNYVLGDDVLITILNKVSNTLNVYTIAADHTRSLVDTIDVTDYEESSIVAYTPESAGWYEIGFALASNQSAEEKNNVGFCINDNVAVFDSSESKLTFSSTHSTLVMVSYSGTTSRAHISDVFPSVTDLENGYMNLTVPSTANWIHAVFQNDYGRTIIEMAVS